MNLRTAYLVFIFSLITSYSYSFDVIDSLKNVLNNHTILDKSRVDILNEIGYHYWTIDPVESERYSQEALELAISLEYTAGIAFANRSMGVANWVQGNYEEGLNNLMKSLMAYETLNDTLNVANVLMNTGLIYREQGSNAEALRYFKEALRTFEILKKPKRIINTANHIGELQEKMGNYGEASGFYIRALNMSDSLNYKYGKATAYLNLGHLYEKKARLDSALIYCNKALLIQTQIQDQHGVATTYFTIGTIYKAQNKLDEADSYLKLALQNAVRISSKKLRSDIYLALKDVARAQDNYVQSLNYLESYVALNDSLLNAEMLRNILRLENRISLEKKEAQVRQQEQELTILQKEVKINALFRNTLIVGILALLIIIYLIYSRQRLKLRKKKELLETNEELLKKEKELAAIAVENAKLKEKELIQDLQFKNKELTSYTLNFMQKNELLSEIRETINELRKSKDPDLKKKLSSLVRLIDSGNYIDREWNDFRRYFEEVHTGFFTNLKKQFPELTNNELRLCALLKLNMNLKEASSILGISPESVKTARYRLRKKLNLATEDNLVDFVINFERATEQSL